MKLFLNRAELSNQIQDERELVRARQIHGTVLQRCAMEICVILDL